MRGLRFHQLVFCAVLGLVLIAAALEARTFRDVASWFPLYFSLVGTVLCGLGVVSGLVRWWRARREAVAVAGADQPASGVASSAVDPGQAQVREEVAVLVAGLRWFALILTYVALVWLLGVALGSVLFVVVWFRTVHVWAWRNIAISVASMLILGWLGQTLVDIEFPPGLLL